MQLRLALRVLAALFGAVASAEATLAQPQPILVSISESADGIRISYELSEPVTELTLGGDSGVPPSRNLGAVEDGLAYRDGAIRGERPFRRATLRIGPDRAEVDSRYPLLTAVAGRGFVLYAPYVLPSAGAVAIRLSEGGGRWRQVARSEADGGSLLVGALPVQAGALRLLVGANLPEAIRSTVLGRAERLLGYYARRLRRPPVAQPLLVLAYAPPAETGGVSFRGEVTPNGVIVMRFRGESAVGDNAATGRYTMFLAHELFHLWNVRLGDHPQSEAWLHEGSADYFAWRAVAALWPGEIALEQNVGRAVKYCAAFLGARPLSGVTGAEERANRYHCGAALQWFVDLGTLNASSGRRDGLDLWADLLAQRPGADYGLAGFRDAAAEQAPGTPALLDAFIETGGTARWGELAEFATAAGAVAEARPSVPAMIRFPVARALVLSACSQFWGAGDTDTEFYVSAPPECEALPGNVTFVRVDGIDPMQADPFHQRIRQRCARREEFPMTIRYGGTTREITLRCTVAVEEPVPDLEVTRALPLSLPVRSAL